MSVTPEAANASRTTSDNPASSSWTGRYTSSTVPSARSRSANSAGYELHNWTLRRYDVPVLAPDADPLRILQITDLHMLPGHRSKQEWVRELAALDPDLVLLTGDNLAHHEAVPSVLHALQPL